MHSSSDFLPLNHFNNKLKVLSSFFYFLKVKICLQQLFDILIYSQKWKKQHNEFNQRQRMREREGVRAALT